MPLADPVSGSLMAFDIERFGDPHRDVGSGSRVIGAFYRLLREAFAAASVPWADLTPEDRGDGALIFVPARFATVVLIDPLFGWLAAALSRHNRQAELADRLRLRIALHRGEVVPTEHGHTGTAVVLACRLLEAPQLRLALRHSDTDLAAIVSHEVYEGVVRHGYRDIDPTAYHPVSVGVKRTRTGGWICLPGSRRVPVIEEPEQPEPATAAPADDKHGITITGTATGERSTGVKIGKLSR